MLHHRGKDIWLLNATRADVRRQERAVETPRFRWGLLWWQIRCVEGRKSL